MGIQCKIVQMSEINPPSSGRALRVSLAIQQYRPLRDAEEQIISYNKIAVLQDDGTAKTLEYPSNSGDRPLFEQNSSMFSTIQPISLKQVLRVNDTVDFEVTSLSAQVVESKGNYVNARGFFNLNSYQVSRLLEKGMASISKPTQPKQSSKPIQVVNLTDKNQDSSASPEEMPF